MKVWILYDGRAELEDENDCAVLEAFSSRRDLKTGLWFWKGHDGVLFEYDAHGNALLTNGRRIGSLREGRKALMSRTANPEHLRVTESEEAPT